MSDLSRLIGNVYRSPGAEAETSAPAPVDETWAPEQVEQLADQVEPAPEPSLEDEWAQLAAEGLAEADAPEWADEAALDEAFADWVPGPPGSAPEAERDALAELPAEAPTGALPGLAALAGMDVSGSSKPASDTTSLWSLDTDTDTDVGIGSLWDTADTTVGTGEAADPWSSIGAVHGDTAVPDTDDADDAGDGTDLFGTWAAWGDEAVADAATATVEEWTVADAGSWALEDEVEEWAPEAADADGVALDYTEAEEWTTDEWTTDDTSDGAEEWTTGDGASDGAHGADEWAIDYAETDQWGGDEAATAWSVDGDGDGEWTVETDAVATWVPADEATAEWAADTDGDADAHAGFEAAVEGSPAADWAADEPAGWDASADHSGDTTWGTLRPTALAAAVEAWATDEPVTDDEIDDDDAVAVAAWERRSDDLLPRASGLRRFRRRR
jgi:hypothetical protein